jgi:hypothetical protein
MGLVFSDSAVQEFDLLKGRKVVQSSIPGLHGDLPVAIGTMEWFELGGHRTLQPTAHFALEPSPVDSPMAIGNIGQQLLAGLKVVFDYRHSRAAFKGK